MAEYCHDRLGQLKDDKQRDFVGDMYVVTQRRTNLSKDSWAGSRASTFRQKLNQH